MIKLERIVPNNIGYMCYCCRENPENLVHIGTGLGYSYLYCDKCLLKDVKNYVSGNVIGVEYCRICNRKHFTYSVIKKSICDSCCLEISEKIVDYLENVND